WRLPSRTLGTRPARSTRISVAASLGRTYGEERSRSTSFMRLTKRSMRSMRSARTSLIVSSSAAAAHGSRAARGLRAHASPAGAGRGWGGPLRRPPPARAVIAAFGQKFESQRARNRRGLDEPHRDAIAEAVGLAAAGADQGMAVFVVAEIIGADGARGDEAVGARVVELDE